MGLKLNAFKKCKLDHDFANWLIDDKAQQIQQHFAKLWDYYTNPIQPAIDKGVLAKKITKTGRNYYQAQEMGLPARITGLRQQNILATNELKEISNIQRKEIVIENDIAWRINASVDFLFGKNISFISKSPDRQKRSEIEKILKAAFAANGGIGFFQDMAVLGSIYGFVDCIVRPGNEIINTSPSALYSLEDALRLTATMTLELIDAPRVLPVLNENNYKKTTHYIQHFTKFKNKICKPNNLIGNIFGNNQTQRKVATTTEIMSPYYWQQYENKELIAEGIMPFEFLPVVHIQNIAQPFYYEGLSDVEALIPMQDELNTRLCDRANRITMQSFKMYLGKGVEGFEDRPVSPGTMWYTDNTDAAIEEFGGDDKMPSEESHISEIREAMDKISGITPILVGVIKEKAGYFKSGVAIKLAMMGALSKTERKKTTYGNGIKNICNMILTMLDKAQIYHTSQQDRNIDVVFPNPLPENIMEKLKESQIKKELGISKEIILKELGYEDIQEN